MESTLALDLAFPPRTEMLRVVRRIVLAALNEAGYAPEEATQIVSSVDEACANVIQHAYGKAESDAKEDRSIRLKIQFGSDHVAIRVADSGVGMPAQGARGVESVEEYAARAEPAGLGSFIIGRFMDEVYYDSGAGKGTVLSMVKYCHPAPEL